MRTARLLLREGKRILTAYLSQPVSVYAAAVAYFTVFSLAPILIIVLGVMGLFLNSTRAQESLLSQFSATFGQSGSDFVRTLIDAHSGVSAGILATVIGFVLIIVGATGIFSALETALDSIFHTFPAKDGRDLSATIWEKVVSLGMVLSIGFVLLASLAVSALLTAIGSKIDTVFSFGADLLSLVSIVCSYLLISLFLGMLMRFIPSKDLAWRPALLGGCIAGAGFMIGRFALSIYFAHSSATSAYGAASAVVLIILWAFYLSQVFFIAAILTKLYFIPAKKRARKGA